MRRLWANLKEPFSGASHWVGVLLAIAGTMLLLQLSHGDARKSVAFGLYGFSLTFLFLASSLYHSLRVSPKVEQLLRKFDHAGIFLLIAGTYVPVCLLKLTPVEGTVLLVLQFTCVVIGIGSTFLLKKFPEVLNVVLYLLMGWMSLAVVGTMRAHWPTFAIAWLIVGGITYTVGAVIFCLDKPNLIPGKFSAHDLWHLFVLGGSACHFLLMTSFVVKGGPIG